MEKIIEKVSQMFILGLEGTDLKSNPNLVKSLGEGLGGVIFFTQNIESETQIQDLISEIKYSALIPPFLSIDQEGGRVERTENIFGGKNYLSAKFAAQKGDSFLKNQTEEIAKYLSKLGFNLNFAPCLDVNTNPKNPIIGERAFSESVDEVIKCGKIVVDSYLSNSIVPCTKHFPGHGDASVDSHVSLPRIDLSFNDMVENHIQPFKEVFSPMIMVAHLHCPMFDQEEIPSSLSPNVIGYLRKELDFDGVVISDDMVMGGVLGLKPIEACIRAIKAGVNILLYRNSYTETVNLISEIASVALSDSVLAKMIDDSYDRIMKLKSEYLK